MSGQRRRAAAVVGVIVGLAGVLSVIDARSATAPAARAQPANPPRPNIVVVMVDDANRADLAALPQTRRLLSTRYARAFSSTPLCCPARASFFSGLYSHNHGVETNKVSSGGGYPAFEPIEGDTLGPWLDPAYRTVFVGKYLNGYSGRKVPSGWDHWAGLSGGRTYNYRHFDLNVNGDVRRVDRYQTTDLTDRAVRQIRRTRGRLFLVVSYMAPHEALGSMARRNGGLMPSTERLANGVFVPTTDRYRGLSTVGLPRSPAVNERDVSDKPKYIRDLPRITVEQRAALVEWRQQRRDGLRYVDDGVARMVRVLKARGVLRDTVIVFVSDNGFLFGEHRLSRKRYPYEPSVGVPLLARGPGFSPGVRGRLVSTVDLTATIVDVANRRTAVGQLDGQSLLRRSTRGAVPVEFLTRGDGIMPPYHGVRTARWSYVRYVSGARELYDMRSDAAQTTDVSPQHPRVVARLQTLTARFASCDGAECR